MSTDSASLRTIGVVGSGAMGAGIAQAALTAGLQVVVHDLNRTALSNARDQILARIARLTEKGQLAADAAEQANGRLLLADDLSALASAQVVVEAIVEKLEPKQALFAALEKIVDAQAVLATNTSSLSVAAIARSCQRRERVCGMHFFNPVPLMKLVEVIGAPDTAERTIQTALALSARLGKTAVRVMDVPGFLVNLLGRAYVTEALHLHHEGVAPVAIIDRIMREAAGFRMGPFELMDFTGIDVNFPATSYIYQGFQHDPRLKTTILHEALLNAGRYGRKSGQGFHSYADEGATRAAVAPRPEMTTALSAFAPESHSGFAELEAKGLKFTHREAADVLLISPDGEDATSACVRLQLDPKRVVAIDFLGLGHKFLTLMAPPGGTATVEALADQLRGLGYVVVVVKDSPGFVAPRILAMVANLGCEVAQIGVTAAPEDIDVAMKLAQNYPRGPLEWAEWLGPQRVLATLQQLQQITGSDRYRPSLWLRRRALLNLPIRTRD
jgi:3-hydroxybutyryl-CoA dehydrogenase